MTKRIFRSVLGCALAVLLAGGLMIMGVLYRYFGTRLQTELVTSTAYIASGIEAGGQGYLLDLSTKDGSRVTWVDHTGKVLFDSWQQASTMENHADRQEIRSALQDGTGRAVRYSATRGCETIYYAQRLSDGSVLRLSTDQIAVWRLLSGVVKPALLVLPLSVLLAFWLAARLARQIVAPINELDPAHPEQVDCYDELAPLLERLGRQNRLIEKQMNELRRKQEEFSAITGHMSEGFLVLDKTARVLSFNEAALRLLEADVPQPEQSVLTLNRSEPVRQAVNAALSGQKTQQLLEKDGRACRILANPAYDNGKLTGAVIVLLDVTETQKREVMRREFTANVSHELKTPLTAIYGTAEIIENGMVRPEDIPHFVQNIRKEAGRLIDLVTDIIRLSRLDEGEIEQQKQPVDLYALAEKVAEQLSGAAKKKELTVSVEGKTAIVSGVPAILEEILYNLCDNAISYNKTGGSVNIAVQCAEDEVVVQVRDTGIGIPAAQSQRVFERFYRVDKSHAGKGTGLGLSIVRHGAAFHNASVRLESEEGEGTCVTLCFPRHKDFA